MRLFDRTRTKIEHAATLRRAGDAPAAVDVLASILVSEPEHAGANAEMARALRVMGDPSGAEEHLRRALSAVLDYTLVCELAAALAEQGKIDEAEEVLDGALAMAAGAPRLDPGEALLVRAAIAAAEGRPEDAAAALDAIEPKRARPLTKEYAERLRAQL